MDPLDSLFTIFIASFHFTTVWLYVKFYYNYAGSTSKNSKCEYWLLWVTVLCFLYSEVWYERVNCEGSAGFSLYDLHREFKPHKVWLHVKFDYTCSGSTSRSLNASIAFDGPLSFVLHIREYNLRQESIVRCVCWRRDMWEIYKGAVCIEIERKFNSRSTFRSLNTSITFDNSLSFVLYIREWTISSGPVVEWEKKSKQSAYYTNFDPTNTIILYFTYFILTLNA